MNDIFDPDFFVSSGCEYYATARFAMHAQRPLICGNLFHHAVEMFLKGGLAKRGKTLPELESMRHNLKKLWRAYKSDHPEAPLERHNKTINRLNRHEEIRYPNPGLGSIGLSLQWSGEPAEVKTSGGLKTPKQYAIVVSDIDDLGRSVQSLSRTCTRQQASPLFEDAIFPSKHALTRRISSMCQSRRLTSFDNIAQGRATS